MTTPQTPSQNQSLEISEPSASALEPGVPSVHAETPRNGETSTAHPALVGGPDAAHAPEKGHAANEAATPDASSGDDQQSTDDSVETDGANGGAHAGPGPGEGQDKKRRRRRRKKKAGGQANGEAAAAGDETDQGTADGQGAEGGETEGKPSTDKADHRDRKREKKHGPPRERPPVNAGDIVFGKIIEITDEALLIDIPGKAKAIFDRREMLLPDDEGETKKRTAHVPPVSRVQESPPDGHGGQDGTVASASPEGTAGAIPIENAPSLVSPPDGAEGGDGGNHGAGATLVPSPVDAGSAAPEAAGGESAPAEGSPGVPPVDLPKEPKVPRVVLEVGADFIGVVHNEGTRGGLVVLTHHPNRAERAKPIIEKAFEEKSLIEGLVTGVIKGGVEIDVDGLRAFAPGSHVDVRLGADLSHLLGKRLPFLVTQYAKRGRDVVLSRRAMIEEEAKKARAEAIAKLKVGEQMEGIVRSVVPFGAFVDVGGVEGLVPLQEMSHNRADGPSDVFKAGEPTQVKIIKIDDRGKIWLSRKATIPDPWQQVAQKYAQGSKHQGKVVRIQPFGAFIELEPGVDGLVHTSDLSIKRIESPGEVVKIGDTIDVVVSHLDQANHKIALHPAPSGEAAGEAPQRVVPHKPVKAKVVNIESGGLVVRILGVTGRNARGYVTAAGTGTPRGTELRKTFTIGQEIEAKVIEMDPRRGEAKLSIKALSEDQERSAYQQYRQQLKAEARFTFADLLTKKKN